MRGFNTKGFEFSTDFGELKQAGTELPIARLQKTSAEKAATIFDKYTYRVTIESKAGHTNQSYSEVLNALKDAGLLYREDRRYTIKPDRDCIDILIEKEDLPIIEELKKTMADVGYQFIISDNLPEYIQNRVITTPEDEVDKTKEAKASKKTASRDDVELKEIARLIREGNTSGYEPNWSLEAKLEEGEPDEVDLDHIAGLVEAGYVEGELVSGENQTSGWWKLSSKKTASVGFGYANPIETIEDLDGDIAMVEQEGVQKSVAFTTMDGGRLCYNAVKKEYDLIRRSTQEALELKDKTPLDVQQWAILGMDINIGYDWTCDHLGTKIEVEPREPEIEASKKTASEGEETGKQKEKDDLHPEAVGASKKTADGYAPDYTGEWISSDGQFHIYETGSDFQIEHVPSGESRSMGDGVDMFTDAEGNSLEIGSSAFGKAMQDLLNTSDFGEAYFPHKVKEDEDIVEGSKKTAADDIMEGFYNEGNIAASEGKTLEANPYDVGTDQHSAWEDGFVGFTGKQASAQEPADVNESIKQIQWLTDRNQHNESILELAKLLGNEQYVEVLKSLMEIHSSLGYMPHTLIDYRNEILKELIAEAESNFGKEISDEIHGSF
jgi:hypothetical protein